MLLELGPPILLCKSACGSDNMVGYYATLSSKELRSASNLAF